MELRVRCDAPRFGQHLAAFDVFALGPAQQYPNVVARLTLVKQLAKHLHPGTYGLDRVFQANDLDVFTHLDHAALNTPRGHCAATGYGEYVFYRHQEGFVQCPRGLGNVFVKRRGKLEYRFFAMLALVAFERLERRAGNNRRVVSRKVVLGEQFTHFHFHQFEQFGIIDHIGLVQIHNDVGNTNLARKQDVFARLRHRPVCCGHY